MSVTKKLRLWFVAGEAIVLGVIFVDFWDSHRGENRALLMPAIALGWPALLITSFILLRRNWRLALVGIASCGLGVGWYCLPEVAE